MSEWLLPLQKMINEALSYDAVAQAKLEQLGECSLVLALQEPNLSLSIVIERDGFVMIEPTAVEPFNAKVSGKAKDLIAVLKSNDRTEAMMSHPINIEGDTRTFFSIQDVLAHLDVDWEMALGDKLGDLPAHLIADGVRFAASVAKNQWSSLQRTKAHMAQEGIELSVPEQIQTQVLDTAKRAKDDIEQLAVKLKASIKGFNG